MTIVELCILCSKDFGAGEVISLRQKGTESIYKARKERGDYLEVKSGTTLHKSCRLE